MNEALTFDDVLIEPNYCGFESRKDVDTTVQLGHFKFSTPVISTNMDTITESGMAKKMAELGGFGILHRFCSIEDNIRMFYEAWVNQNGTTNLVGVSVGVNEGLDRAKALYEAGARIFCVDVAHGHSKLVNRQIKAMKAELEGIYIIAGNVATYAGADYLVGCGADAIKVGIGPGCFVPNSMVRTFNGLKAIQDIQVGDRVQTHTGQFQEVTALMNRPHYEDIVQVNNIQCTPNHEFYVVDKSKQNFITEDNLKQYAYWIPAAELDKTKHLLVELE